MFRCFNNCDSDWVLVAKDSYRLLVIDNFSFALYFKGTYVLNDCFLEPLLNIKLFLDELFRLNLKSLAPQLKLFYWFQFMTQLIKFLA